MELLGYYMGLSNKLGESHKLIPSFVLNKPSIFKLRNVYDSAFLEKCP